MKVLCLGHATWDVVIPVDEFPRENTKNRIKEGLECGGGPASNAAYLLGKWGCDVSFAGVVGDDINGNKVFNEFKSDNVNTKYLEKNHQHTTTSSYIIVNTKTGSRTSLAYHPTDMKLSLDINEDFDYLLIDGQEYEMSKKIIQSCKLVSVIDAGRCNEEVIDLCHMVDYIVCSKDFAQNYTNKSCDNLEEVFEIMNRDFKGKVIITLEDKGCAYYDKGVQMLSTIKVKAIDSTGAGDIFHGAFVYGLMQGWSLKKILFFANITGSMSVSKLGGRNSIFSLSDVRRVANEVIGSNIY